MECCGDDCRKRHAPPPQAPQPQPHRASDRRPARILGVQLWAHIGQQVERQVPYPSRLSRPHRVVERAAAAALAEAAAHALQQVLDGLLVALGRPAGVQRGAALLVAAPLRARADQVRLRRMPESGRCLARRVG